ncbi:ScbR family autoregulator-binding transcription factor [Streptomyces gamaensis]|uniref:ScbR family autoregulator-binding transcription factor n=1 Tax=Streptomyces gamaensis TaxID=1763542 RepID=A0ABW0YYJ3_9ACTN
MTKQERAAATRHALLRSAARTFDQHGFAQAKLTGISSGAGVSPGALHFHFDTKAAVAAAVEAEAARTLRGLARTARQRGRPVLQSLIDTTHVLAQQIHWDVVVRAGLRLNRDTPHAAGVNLRQEWLACVREAFAHAEAEGSLRAGCSPEDAAATVFAATTGIEALGRDNPEWLSRTSLTGLWQTLLPSVAAPGAHGGLDPRGTESSLDAGGEPGGASAGRVRPLSRASADRAR